jgi:hypothetical protein
MRALFPRSHAHPPADGRESMAPALPRNHEWRFRRLRGMAAIALGLFVPILATAAARGQESRSAADDGVQQAAPAKDQSRSAASASTADGKPARQARGIAIAAVYLVVGIAMVGALLIALVMLWGARMRRGARTRLPPTPPPDPLWHLKPRREPGNRPDDRTEDAGPARD